MEMTWFQQRQTKKRLYDSDVSMPEIKRASQSL
jgi:hypothetical protein